MRPAVVLAVLAVLVAVAGIVAIGIGPVDIGFTRAVTILTGGETASATARIVREVRLPRVLLAILVGVALSVAGTAFQGLLRNPLADPFILGTSSGAALVATVLMATGIASGSRTGWLLPLASFVGSLVALIGVYSMARVGGRVPVEVLLLSGVIVNAFLFALVLLVLAMADAEAVQVVLWLMGSLDIGAAAGGGRLLGLVAVLVAGASLALWSQSRDLDAMSLGEEQAAHLGVDTERLKRRLFVIVSVIVGAAVSVSGIIGFVGLIVPHLARMTVGAAHRTLLPAAALLGALFLLVADCAARTALAPKELPVGVVTALAGAPFFVYLLRRARRVQ